MPRVNTVEKARKDYPEAGIIKGEKYYWWQFRTGGKHRSKTYPKQSQLTQSPFKQNFLELTERVENISLSNLGEVQDIEADDLESFISDLVDEVTNIKDELESNRDNLPEQFQESGPGEIITNRIDALEAIISDLESVNTDIFSELEKPIDPNSEEAKNSENENTENEEEKDTRTYEEKLEEYNSDKETKIEEFISEVQEAFSNNSVD